MIHASSSIVGGGTVTIACVLGCGAAPPNSAAGSCPSAGAAGTYAPPSPMTPWTCASPNTSRARSSESSASTGTYAAPAAMIPRIEM